MLFQKTHENIERELIAASCVIKKNFPEKG